MFPVEEAQAVQEFLDVVSNAMEEDLEEELSSEQLMEKIEQLEVCVGEEGVLYLTMIYLAYVVEYSWSFM